MAILPILSENKLKRIENQIDLQRRSVSFNMREFTIEIYVKKYLEHIDEDENELYVPDYQREFIWDNRHQSRFIESLLLGLPVPFIFSAEIRETGRLEIVDGSQRIRTMAAYLNDELKLNNLEKLTELNDTYFSQLPAARQRMFRNAPMRMVVLSADATEEVRKEMFDRINTSSVALLPMETRRGIYRGTFTDFIINLAKDERYRRLCPLPHYMKNRREEEELLLRFFAFSDCYPNYSEVEAKGVAKYLDNYIQQKNSSFTEAEKQDKMAAFNSIVDFISDTYPEQGFAKKRNITGISRPYFEAISIGSFLAIRENPNIAHVIPNALIIDKHHRNVFYGALEGRYQTHTATKIKRRIDIAKEAFLNDTYE
jgi:hypothetical protein